MIKILTLLLLLSTSVLADLRIPGDESHPSDGCGWASAPSIYQIEKSNNNSCTPAFMCMGDVVCKGGVQSKCAYLVEDGKCGTVKKCYDDKYTAWGDMGANADNNDEESFGSSPARSTRQ